MAGKLSPKAQTKLSELSELNRQVQHVHGLVEQFAAARTGNDQLAQVIRRTFGRLKLKLMGAGFDSLSQLAGSMEIAAGRGASHNAKARILRDGVASIRFQLELEERMIRQEDAQASAAEE